MARSLHKQEAAREAARAGRLLRGGLPEADEGRLRCRGGGRAYGEVRRMNVLVAYESRSGHTRRAAEAIGEAARSGGATVTVRRVADVTAAEVGEADVLFVGTWVEGLILFGVKPAGTGRWAPALPSLDGKPVGAFCTYAFNPRGTLATLGDVLRAKGATVVGERAFHRRRPTAGAEAFAKSVLAAAGTGT